MLRVKAWLVVTRNATRDYLDVVALAERLEAAAPAALAEIDDYYDAGAARGRAPVATQVMRQLAEPLPYDLDEIELREYRGLDGRWQDWDAVVAACVSLSAAALKAYGRSREGR